jgi:hypothetical protein
MEGELMKSFMYQACLIAAALAFAGPAAADTIVINGILDDNGVPVWRWVDPAGGNHDSGLSLGTAKEVVDPAQRLVGRLVVPVKNNDKVRFEVEAPVSHGTIFEHGKIETAGAAPVWTRLAGSALDNLPTAAAFNRYDRTKANLTDAVSPPASGSALIIEIEIKDLPEDQPIFFSCRVHSVNNSKRMFGALVLDTNRNVSLAKRVVATSRMVSTGTSNKLSYDEALKDAVSKLPPSPFPDGIRTFSVVEVNGTLGGIAGVGDLRVTIIAQDQPLPEIEGHTRSEPHPDKK